MSRKRTTEEGEGSDNGLANLPPLPAGWCWTTLEEIAEIVGGITKDQKRRQTTSTREVPYLRVANVQRGYLDLGEMKTILADEGDIKALRLEKGDILFTEGGDRDKLGRGWVWNEEIEECIHQNHIFRARPLLTLVEPKFVSYHGNHFGQDWFTKAGKQTTNLASINKGILRRFPVPVAPIEEQRRIVARIDELFSDIDAGVDALERISTKLKMYRASVLKAAVEGKLTEEWRAKHPDVEAGSVLLDRILAERRRRWEERQLLKFAEAGQQPPEGWQAKYVLPTAPRARELPNIPHRWIWAIVEQVAEIQGGIQKQPSRAPRSNPHSYLRVANVLRGRLNLEEIHKIELFDGELERLRLDPGDLLIVEGNGSRTEIGRSALWNGEICDCVHQNHIIRARSLLSLPKFLDIYWNSPGGTQRVFQVAASTSGLYTLSVGKISSLPVPLPPLEEQHEIVAEVDQRLSIVDELEAQVEANLKRASRLRQCILRRAFEGKLVPQDPDDEPADRLLERIRQAKNQDTANQTTHESRPKSREPARRKQREGDPSLFD